MAMQVYAFTGKAAYVSKNGKVFKDGEAPVWTMNFYPRTAADRKAVKDTGIRNQVKEDDGSKSGVEGFFYTFRSKEPYEIVDDAGNGLEALVGNGSEVTVFLEVETFRSQKFGPQARSTLKKVKVDKLIEYKPEGQPTDTATNEVPA